MLAAGKRGRSDREEKENGRGPTGDWGGARWLGRNIPSDDGGERGGACFAGEGREGRKGKKNKGDKEKNERGEKISRKIETEKGSRLNLETESKYRLYLETEKKKIRLYF